MGAATLRLAPDRAPRAQIGDLFPNLVEILWRQFDVLGDEFFEADSFLVSSQAGYMAEDMIDTGVAEIAEKGKAFSAYIKKRKR